ncbi:MAG: hypothetical protein R3B93_24115 [Bacteroidia bacterium]
MELKDGQLEFLHHKDCESLQALSLIGNQLGEFVVPETLQELKYLILNHNEGLKEVTFKQGLKKLERLDLNTCGLEELETVC